MIVAPTLSTGHNAERPRANGAASDVSTIDLSPPAEQEKGVPTPLVRPGNGRSKRDASTMAHAYALAAELAQPVARGDLTLTEAHASLLATTLRAVRAGNLAPANILHAYKLQQHVLGLHLEQLEHKRAVAEMKVRRRLRPLLALRKPSNVVLAEAHDVNGAEGFPFAEPEITDIAARETYFVGRQRHGR